jgi:xanthine dehydrogenase accessory factor
VRYQSDGVTRHCIDGCRGGEPHPWIVDHAYSLGQRLVVVGSDPIALAIARLGARLGWSVAAVWPHGPDEPPELGVLMRRDSPQSAIISLATDNCTAIAVATHDHEQDEAAILAALGTPAGYIGILGARRRIPDRIARLRACGIAEGDIARLRMPIGLSIGAATPWEIALSVAAGIVAARRDV